MRLPIAALAALLAAMPATAQTAPEGKPARGGDDQPGRPEMSTVFVEPVGMMIAAFDSDGDGRVTRAEFDTGLRHSFDVIDKQHHGSIGYIAFADWAELWMGNRTALPSPFEVDRDGDNQITFPELADRFDLIFKRFDKNGDGVIVRSELITIRTGDFGRDGPDGGKRGRRRR